MNFPAGNENADQQQTQSLYRVKVVLFAYTLQEPLRELVLALAASGYSLAIWRGAKDDESSLRANELDLQFAIERAGGISLIGGWPGDKDTANIAWAVEAFGHLDVAIAWGSGQERRMHEAIAALDRRSRPKALILLSDQNEMISDFPEIRGTRIIHNPQWSKLKEEAERKTAIEKLIKIIEEI